MEELPSTPPEVEEFDSTSPHEHKLQYLLGIPKTFTEKKS
jgi:hypothetical protein